MTTLLAAAVGDEISTSRLLHLVRVLAVRSGEDKLKEIETWAEQEAEGYDEGTHLPEHRVWSLEIRVTLHNPMQGVASNVLLPPTVLGEKWKEITTYRCTTGITEIERSLGGMSEREGQGHMLRVEHPHLPQLVQQAEGVLWNCLDARAEFAEGHLSKVVEHARSRVRKFSLECEREGLSIRIVDVLEGEAVGAKDGVWSKFGRETIKRLAMPILLEVAKAQIRRFVE